MERHCFDALARALAVSGSRRALGALLGSAVSWVTIGPGAPGAGLAGKKQNKKRRQKGKVRIEGPCGNGSAKKNACKRDNQCCTNYCKKGRCRCRTLNQSCTEDRNCCPERTGRTCQAGTCQPLLTCVDLGEACGDGLPCCAGASCQDGVCQPLPTFADTCAGCCDGETCQEGTTPQACGVEGESCQVCAETERCWDGECVCGDVCESGCQFSSLQQAINAANAGGTIRLCAETYGETFTISKTLILIGTGSEPDGTILDGQGNGTAVTVASGVTGVLEGVRITGGNTEGDGGASPTLET